jgi:hypothetical protein
MRLFYVVLGATAGVILVRRLSRAAESWTPEGLTSRLGATIGGFVNDVRDGMAERESDLRVALGIDGEPTESRAESVTE